MKNTDFSVSAIQRLLFEIMKFSFEIEKKEKKNYGEKKNGEALWPAGPGPFRREKNDGTPDAIM